MENLSALAKTAIFIFWTICDVAYLPVLKVVLDRKRHFEVWVLVLNIICRGCYNSAEALGWNRFLFVGASDWHLIGDILSETLILLVLIHIMGLKNADWNTFLRYLAFTLLWLAKQTDGWDSIYCETVVLVIFIVPTIFRMLGLFSPRPPYQMDKLCYSVCSGGIAAVLFELHMYQNGHIWITVLVVPICNILFSASLWFAFHGVRCMDKKEDDGPILPMFN